MPTNILRKQSGRGAAGAAKQPQKARGLRRIVLRVGRVTLRAELLDTLTAERIWGALPIHSTVETFGKAIHFEVPVESGRERGAKILAALGELYYWSEEDGIILAFGPTPISRPGQIRLPSPCNLWAKTLDDLSPLKNVTPGEKVSLSAA